MVAMKKPMTLYIFLKVYHTLYVKSVGVQMLQAKPLAAGLEHVAKTARRIKKLQSIFCDMSEYGYRETHQGRRLVGYYLCKGKKGVKVISYRKVHVEAP